jgi:hypothetical protein
MGSVPALSVSPILMSETYSLLEGFLFESYG